MNITKRAVCAVLAVATVTVLVARPVEAKTPERIVAYTQECTGADGPACRNIQNGNGYTAIAASGRSGFNIWWLEERNCIQNINTVCGNIEHMTDNVFAQAAWSYVSAHGDEFGTVISGTFRSMNYQQVAAAWGWFGPAPTLLVSWPAATGVTGGGVDVKVLANG